MRTAPSESHDNERRFRRRSLTVGAAAAAGIAAALTFGIPDMGRHSPSAAQAAEASQSAVANEAQYDRLALQTGSGRALNMSQLLFIIDRSQDAANGGRVYWINSKRYPLHYHFVRETYLSTSDMAEFNNVNYLSDRRRFIIGSVVRYPDLHRYGVEMWEGDTIDLRALRTAMRSLQRTFFAPLAFKPNSDAQEALVAESPGLDVITPQAAYGSRDRLVLNEGRAIGRLRIVDDADDADVGRGDIVILRSNPITLEPVAGVVTTNFTTPLSHVNLLAGTWNIPNGYLRNADRHYAELENQIVVLETRGQSIRLRRATPSEIESASRRTAMSAPRMPTVDIAYAGMPSLAEQRAIDVVRTGAKSANLGEVFRHSTMSPEVGFTVPPGFTLPFHYYDSFVRANGIDRMIASVLADPLMATNRDHRHHRLAALRAAFLSHEIANPVMTMVIRRRQQVVGSGSVFARSSTNSEDLKGFNGAGLYTSVPNVRGDAELAKAIRTVWSSVWNDRAYEAREAAGIDHRGVRAAVLIQLGVDSEASGVMVTGNPFDPSEEGAVFINAKRGLGMRVVEGRKMAEQLVYHQDTGTVQVLTRSTDDTMLTFDAKGGVKPVTIDPNRRVLNDGLTRRLAAAGLIIRQWFGGVPQDIEWLTVGGRVVVVQARPYQQGGRKS